LRKRKNLESNVPEQTKVFKNKMVKVVAVFCYGRLRLGLGLGLRLELGLKNRIRLGFGFQV
jgi:hypothetical protein